MLDPDQEPGRRARETTDGAVDELRGPGGPGSPREAVKQQQRERCKSVPSHTGHQGHGSPLGRPPRGLQDLGGEGSRRRIYQQRHEVGLDEARGGQHPDARNHLGGHEGQLPARRGAQPQEPPQGQRGQRGPGGPPREARPPPYTS